MADPQLRRADGEEAEEEEEELDETV